MRTVSFDIFLVYADGCHWCRRWCVSTGKTSAKDFKDGCRRCCVFGRRWCCWSFFASPSASTSLARLHASSLTSSFPELGGAFLETPPICLVTVRTGITLAAAGHFPSFITGSFDHVTKLPRHHCSVALTSQWLLQHLNWVAMQSQRDQRDIAKAIPTLSSETSKAPLGRRSDHSDFTLWPLEFQSDIIAKPQRITDLILLLQFFWTRSKILQRISSRCSKPPSTSMTQRPVRWCCDSIAMLSKFNTMLAQQCLFQKIVAVPLPSQCRIAGLGKGLKRYYQCLNHNFAIMEETFWRVHRNYRATSMNSRNRF